MGNLLITGVAVETQVKYLPSVTWQQCDRGSAQHSAALRARKG